MISFFLLFVNDRYTCLPDRLCRFVLAPLQVSLLDKFKLSAIYAVGPVLIYSDVMLIFP